MDEKAMVARFVDNIRLIGRKNRNLNETEQACGVTKGYLSRYKNGRSPTLLTALRFANAVGENLMDLCTVDYEDRLLDNEIETLEKKLEELKERRRRK